MTHVNIVRFWQTLSALSCILYLNKMCFVYFSYTYIQLWFELNTSIINIMTFFIRIYLKD